jgi:putative membrane protein
MQSTEKRVIGIAAIIYTVGVIGLSFGNAGIRHYFIQLTPVNLAASLLIPLLFQKKWTVGLLLGLLCVGAAGFFIEYAGVHTGLVFGNYHYGKTLGPGWHGIPFMIAVNWAMLIFFTTSFLAGKVSNPWFLAAIGGLMMTCYDFIMEPVAVWMDLWHWQKGIIPNQNYLAWFICSFILVRLFIWMSKIERNNIAIGLLVIQTLFFGVLRLIL